MLKGNYLEAILRSPKTVFSSRDIALIWQETPSVATRVRINYLIKKGSIFQIRKGLYAKSNEYNKLELATRILVPSYVSFETVLVKEGLIFQYYTPIFVASYTNREISVGDQSYIFRKIKTKTLVNSIGVENTSETSIATKERAFLDMLYTKPNYHFDNTRSLNWDLVFEILPVYSNQKMAKMVTSLYKNRDSEKS